MKMYLLTNFQLVDSSIFFPNSASNGSYTIIVGDLNSVSEALFGTNICRKNNILDLVHTILVKEICSSVAQDNLRTNNKELFKLLQTNS